MVRTPEADGAERWKRHLPWSAAAQGLALVAVLLGVWLAYEPAMDGAFVIDDENTILVDAGVRELLPLGRFLQHNRPLTELSYALTWSWAGPIRGRTTSPTSARTR